MRSRTMERLAGALGLALGTLACSSGGADAAPEFSSAAPAAEPQRPALQPAAGEPGASPPSAIFSDEALAGGDAPPRTGCTKVDLLFVVDNSLSMREEQQALIASFPRFVQVVQDRLSSSDFQIMVIDTDAENALDLLALVLAPVREPCAATLGAGRRTDFRGQDCGLSGARRYMDRSQPSLSSTFSCVAQVGTLGNPGETPVGALLAAIAPEQNAAGGCNEGFLRDDAILVVTLIGDEDDRTSPGGPLEWYDAIVRAKGGDEGSVVMLALTGGDAATQPELAACGSDGAQPAPRLRELVESFSFGSTGSVCAPDYSPFFERSVEAIDLACVAFVPTIR